MSEEGNSACRNSTLLGSHGGRSSSAGHGHISSADRNHSSGAKSKKKAGWEDAGLEFYREAYPGVADNLYGTRLHTLLPSKRYSVGTLGRTGRRRPSMRTRRRQSTATTLVHTTRRGSDTYLEVLPDLTQGVDEEETWEQLQEIRLHAVSMSEKKEMKKQLLSVPTLRTRGFAAVQLSRRKFTSQMKSRVKELISKTRLWRGSLRFVEGNFGTGLVAFFTFIKWLLYLNLFSSLLIILLIVVPQTLFSYSQVWCNEDRNHTIVVSIMDAFYSKDKVVPRVLHLAGNSEASYSLAVANDSLNFLNETEWPSSTTVLTTENSSNTNASVQPTPALEADQYCCYSTYKEEVQNRDQKQPHWIQWVLDGLQGTGQLELSHLFYGYYPRLNIELVEFNGWKYRLPLAYLAVMVFIMLVSLVCMARKAARGLHERLRSSEGQFYQFSNLVFGGWDHCIENTKASNIKKKAIYNELCNLLETERYKEEKRTRTKKQQCRLLLIRLIVNVIVVVILGASFYGIYDSTRLSFSKLSQLNSENGTVSSAGLFETSRWYESLIWEYLPVAAIVSLNIVVSFIFKILVGLERYTPNFILSITLFRTLFLRLSSLVVLMFSIYEKIKGCQGIPDDHCSNSECPSQLRCWETYVGQQMYKLVILDLIAMVLSAFVVNFPRKLIGDRLLRGTRVGEMIGGIEFEIPKHVLDVVYGQTLCWLGMFYSPMLPAITCLKLVLVFYIKYFDCSVNTSQSSQLYRTSRSNSLFISVLLISFVVTMVPVGFSIAELEPSQSCGPFSSLQTISMEISNFVQDSPGWVKSCVFFLRTAGFAVPAIIVLALWWYYYYAVSIANKHMVTLLKHQLVLEGHDKQFLLTRLERMVKRAKELEDMQRSELNSEFIDTEFCNEDLTLDIRATN